MYCSCFTSGVCLISELLCIVVALLQDSVVLNAPNDNFHGVCFSLAIFELVCMLYIIQL